MYDLEYNNDDVQASFKALFEAIGYHTNLPIFNDSYSTLLAHQLANSPIEENKEKTRRKISDDKQRAIFRFMGYSSKGKPPIS